MLHFLDGSLFEIGTARYHLLPQPSEGGPLLFKGRKLRPASVLIPILQVEGEWSLLFTRRSEKLKNHRGQVSFPGGGADAVDRNEAETALREANEEIGLSRDNVEILGYLPSVPTVSFYCVTPVVGWIKQPFEMILSQDEVARAFSIPLKWLVNPENVAYKSLETPWGIEPAVVFFNVYDEEIVWGFTGRLTLDLLVRLHLRKKGD